MEYNTFEIDGLKTKFFGNLTGSTEVKFNRVAMIGNEYEKIVDKMYKIINRDKDIFPTTKDYNSAVAVLLILQLGIRIGNEESSEGYMTVPMPNSKIKPKFVKTYGLTTLLPKHIINNNGKVYFDFLGKKHVQNKFTLPSHLGKMVLNILDSDYKPVFNLKDTELTKFIKDKISVKYSSKDFRTFRANWYAFKVIKDIKKPTTKKEYKEGVEKVAVYVSTLLNNTKGVVKKSYIDPRVFEYHLGNIESFSNSGLIKFLKNND